MPTPPNTILSPVEEALARKLPGVREHALPGASIAGGMLAWLLMENKLPPTSLVDREVVAIQIQTMVRGTVL